ncbi:MAG: hypothetical protein ACXQT3_02040, partial [Methermicoccaceae archaeon]
SKSVSINAHLKNHHDGKAMKKHIAINIDSVEPWLKFFNVQSHHYSIHVYGVEVMGSSPQPLICRKRVHPLEELER